MKQNLLERRAEYRILSQYRFTILCLRLLSWYKEVGDHDEVEKKGEIWGEKEKRGNHDPKKGEIWGNPYPIPNPTIADCCVDSCHSSFNFKFSISSYYVSEAAFTRHKHQSPRITFIVSMQILHHAI